MSGGVGIPPWLNEDVEYDAVLIHGAPNILLHAPDANELFIEVPFVSGPLAKIWPNWSRRRRTVSWKTTTTRPAKKQRDIRRTQAKHVMQPDGMRVDFGEKAMAAVVPGGGFMPRVSSNSVPAVRPALRVNVLPSEP